MNHIGGSYCFTVLDMIRNFGKGSNKFSYTAERRLDLIRKVVQSFMKLVLDDVVNNGVQFRFSTPTEVIVSPGCSQKYFVTGTLSVSPSLVYVTDCVPLITTVQCEPSTLRMVTPITPPASSFTTNGSIGLSSVTYPAKSGFKPPFAASRMIELRSSSYESCQRKRSVVLWLSIVSEFT